MSVCFFIVYFVCVCVCVCLSVCLSLCLSVCLSLCLSEFQDMRQFDEDDGERSKSFLLSLA